MFQYKLEGRLQYYFHQLHVLFSQHTFVFYHLFSPTTGGTIIFTAASRVSRIPSNSYSLIVLLTLRSSGNGTFRAAQSTGLASRFKLMGASAPFTVVSFSHTSALKHRSRDCLLLSDISHAERQTTPWVMPGSASRAFVGFVVDAE